jgi:uncharacterized protein (UPF0333 family)
MQDATKVLLGQTLSSAKNISRYDSDPASFPAGVAVSLGSSGALSLLKSAGMRVGVSLGRSLSDHKKTAVVRDGERVPMLAHLKRASCVVTITSYANLVATSGDTLAVAGVTFTAQSGAATLGQATFQAATSNNATATSLAAQINAHATASAKVYAVASSATVTIYSIVDGVGSTGTGNDIAVAYTDTHSEIGITIAGLSGGKLDGGSDDPADIDYIVKGANAYINDASGKLDVNMSGFSTVSDAIYVDGPLTGVNEDSSEVAAGLVDMVGGL